MGSRKVNYIISGRRWAWGWHRHEARAMVGLLVVVAVLDTLGLIAGVAIGTMLGLPVLFTLFIAIGIVFLASVIGFAIAKPVVLVIWALSTTKEMED